MNSRSKRSEVSKAYHKSWPPFVKNWIQICFYKMLNAAIILFISEMHGATRILENLMIRVQEYGAVSYWPTSMARAKEVVDIIIGRNGCGNVQQRQPDGTWQMTHRFDRAYGMVST